MSFGFLNILHILLKHQDKYPKKIRVINTISKNDRREFSSSSLNLYFTTIYNIQKPKQLGKNINLGIVNFTFNIIVCIDLLKHRMSKVIKHLHKFWINSFNI